MTAVVQGVTMRTLIALATVTESGFQQPGPMLMTN